MNRILAVGVIILFIGVSVGPSINAFPYRNADTTTISVEFIGCNQKKSYTLEVSLSQALTIKTMLDSHSKELENITSKQESLSIILDIFKELEANGLIERNDRTRIIDFYRKWDDVGFSGNGKRVIQNKQNYTNIFAFLISHSDSSVYELNLPELVGSAIMYLGLYFWMELRNLPLAALCGILAGPFLLLGVLLKYMPLKFWAFIDSESSTEIWSIGLKGFDHAVYPFAGFIGFKGVMINIPFTASYCIGHAFAILTEPINPVRN